MDSMHSMGSMDSIESMDSMGSMESMDSLDPCGMGRERGRRRVVSRDEWFHDIRQRIRQRSSELYDYNKLRQLDEAELRI